MWYSQKVFIQYSIVRAFTCNEEIAMEALKGPVLVGGRDIKLSHGERAILTRGPKFTVRRVMNLEGFLVEMHKCFVLSEKKGNVRIQKV